MTAGVTTASTGAVVGGGAAAGGLGAGAAATGGLAGVSTGAAGVAVGGGSVAAVSGGLTVASVSGLGATSVVAKMLASAAVVLGSSHVAGSVLRQNPGPLPAPPVLVATPLHVVRAPANRPPSPALAGPAVTSIGTGQTTSTSSPATSVGGTPTWTISQGSQTPTLPGVNLGGGQTNSPALSSGGGGAGGAGRRRWVRAAFDSAPGARARGSRRRLGTTRIDADRACGRRCHNPIHPGFQRQSDHPGERVVR